MEDHELLQEFVQKRSQDAFRQLVDRNLPMVYSAACRLAGNSHLAQEVAQEVFTTLAQKAENIGSHQVLGGWLYKTTRHLAMHAVRTEVRRHTRERIAVSLHSTEQDNSPEEIFDYLEPAMAELEDADHDALVLRYLQDRTLKEVGLQMGVSEDAARMRVNRALDRLRNIFEARGVSVASTALASVLITGSAAAVPSTLAGSISLAAVGVSSAAAATLGAVTITTMHWLNTKSVAAIIAASVLAASGTYFLQQGKIDQLRAEQETFAAEQGKLASAYEASRTSATAMESELEQLRRSTSELMRLRNEVAGIRRERDAAKQAEAATKKSAPAIADNAPAPFAFPPGSFVSKDQLVFAGYDTPEAGVQSFLWAMMKGGYDKVNEASGPVIRDNEEDDRKGREAYEKGLPIAERAFKGFQILARKDVSEDQVELKMKTQYHPVPERRGREEDVSIETLDRVNGEWKLNGGTRGYREEWDKEGDVRSYAP